jgi:hypothetical protein
MEPHLFYGQKQQNAIMAMPATVSDRANQDG